MTLKVDGQSYQDVITKLREEALKEYIEYDAQNRIERRVQTNKEAKTNGASLETKYWYVGTTNRVQYKEERIVAWDSSWEQS